MEPYTFITTIQPVIVAWVGAISFFVSLAIVAIISRGRHWSELVCLFLLAFGALTVAGLAIVQGIFDIYLIELQILN